MRNFKEKLIKEIELEEFNYLYPYYGPEHDEEGDEICNNVIHLKGIYCPNRAIKIDTVVDTLIKLKHKGVDSVYLYAHADHRSYILTGVKLTEIGEEIFKIKRNI